MIEWSDAIATHPSDEVVNSIFDTTFLDTTYWQPDVEDIGQYVARLAVCPCDSHVTIDAYRDETEAAVLVASRFRGSVSSFDECDLKTQVVMIRRRYQAAYCRLELADFSPKGNGIGVRYFAMLTSRLRQAGFSEITHEAAGRRGERYNGYVAWAALGAELILTPDLIEQAGLAGFNQVRTTHDLFRLPDGRR